MSYIDRRKFLQSVAIAGSTLAVEACTGAQSTAASTAKSSSGGAVVSVNARRRKARTSRTTTGVNGAKFYDDGLGIYDSHADKPNSAIIAKVRRSGIGLIRYPGGTSANLFDWKRAIGPQHSRGLQVVGQKEGTPADSRYGPDEYMQVIRAIDGEPQIMAAFANSSPQEAADWVEYMNGDRTTKWGALRAEHGHPEPYGVRYWEVGNELHLLNQRYWMSADDETALHQYAFGGTQRQHVQHVGTPSDHRAGASKSSGAKRQEFTVHFPPAVPKSQTVYVNGTAWKQVDDLVSAGVENVYAFEPLSGTIAFGDGRHGAIPPHGATITADYDSGPHAGFTDFYRAMKSVDPSIDVLATWAPIEHGKLKPGLTFPELMAQRGHAHDYDGVTIHPYTNFSRDLGVTSFPDRRAGHDFQMLGEAASTGMIIDLQKLVSRHAKPSAYVTTTEAGALFFGVPPQKVYREFSYAMSHALYVASLWARFLDLGLPWAVSNDLILETDDANRVGRTVFGSPSTFIASADAVAREQLRPVLHGGGHVLDTTVQHNTSVSTRETPLGSSYAALVTTATLADSGALNVVVVNRTPDAKIDATVSVAGFHSRVHVDATVVAGDAFDSFNDEKDPTAVMIERSKPAQPADSRTVRWIFQPHSVTVLRLTPAT